MRKLTYDSFIKKVKRIHGNRYDYSKVKFINTKTKIEIICKEHGSFWQTPSNHIFHKQNCPKCGIITAHLSTTKTQKRFLKDAIKLHNKEYDYSDTIYQGNNKKIIIKCFLHGAFYQSPDKHLRGQGCPKCRYIKSGKSLKKSIEKFIEESQKVHRDRYDYSAVCYSGSNQKVKIICKKHGEFWQWPFDHLYGAGCPKCGTFISKGSTCINNFLLENNIKFKTEKTFDTCKNPKTNYKLRFDFYIPTKNILIEYDGEQHFNIGSKLGGKHITTKEELYATQYRDSVKTQWAKNNNIKLVRINYFQKNNIYELLQKELL